MLRKAEEEEVGREDLQGEQNEQEKSKHKPY